MSIFSEKMDNPGENMILIFNDTSILKISFANAQLGNPGYTGVVNFERVDIEDPTIEYFWIFLLVRPVHERSE